ncbi:uncharacterized protein LOC126741447 [Anthonomus grandis grandis]|uniref:uncharacterized protein LOC126741447 n=1 Tax=Anthonomus grandis grandis TaxID=2921223 RepID=UPI002166768F|nr:uncharacterized protein LOC126741447 [Anthonomus grandis grandis]
MVWLYEYLDDSLNTKISCYSENSSDIIPNAAENQQKQIEKEREEFFNWLKTTKRHSIFHLSGTKIDYFSSTKIKFSFFPCQILPRISTTYIFSTKIKYLPKYKQWILSKEPIPAMPLFRKATRNNILIDDDIDELTLVIKKVYKHLIYWSKEEIEFRDLKFQNYKQKLICYIELDEVDLELNFSDDERREMYAKKASVLRRMLVPTLNVTNHLGRIK